MKRVPVTVIETSMFLRDAKALSEDEHMELISFLAYNPDAGDIIPGTGGVRKLRFAKEGRGKSGGYRIIYFFHSTDIPLFALNLFAKNEKSNLTAEEKNMMKELAKRLVSTYRS